MAYFSDVCEKVYAWALNLKTTPWVFLRGPLGAGKTTLTSELLEKFGFDKSQVQSPTFLKLIAYEKQNQYILHMDAYRVEDSTELLRLGLEDYGQVVLGVVEWPDRFEELLKNNPLLLEALDVNRVLRIELGANHEVLSFEEGSL